MEAYDAALTVYTMDTYPRQSIGLRTGLSWTALLARNFERARSAADIRQKLEPADLPLEMNRAHALLFLNQVDAAKGIYLKHVGEKIGEKTSEAVILEDFDELEKNGLFHPQMKAIRELLKPTK